MTGNRDACMTSFQLPPCLIPPRSSVKTGVEWRQQHASWLYRGALDGTILDHETDEEEAPLTPKPHRVDVYEVGRMSLPGGRIDVGDAFFADGEGFAQLLPVGEHTFMVASGTIEEGHQRVMAGLLLTGTQPIMQWTEGHGEQESDDDLAVGEYHAFPIDSGLAAFFNPPGPDQAIEDRDPVDVDQVYNQFQANGFDGVIVQDASGLPMAVFASGWGDGRYPTWFGHAADGSVSVVMADFFVFEDPFPDEDVPEDDEPAVSPAAALAMETLLTPMQPLTNDTVPARPLSPIVHAEARPLWAESENIGLPLSEMMPSVRAIESD